jgi:hypothetical protein
MASGAPKVPWDQRLTEHLARQAREAANDPARRHRNPPFREQIRSPYYWLSIIAFGATLLIGRGGKPGWMYGLVVVLYLLALIAGEAARRHACRRLASHIDDGRK